MSSLKEVRWSQEASSGAHAGRALMAAALRCASAVLSQLAARMSSEPAVAVRGEPRYEFHADAGAPEGALYVDGHLVGWLPGVRRL